ncbi:MAG: MFS transporter [Rickettsia sp.]|jgi:MFS family permease|nr:MFS transporter [Rickettsia sp.]
MTHLPKKLKQAIALLSFGTFLEYADLMLYIHMGVVLNELFFNTDDPNSTKLLTATGVAITFGFRPIGAFIFGWIGDNFGRIIVLYITTMIMGVTCIIMANLPTYSQIGIIASVGITLCRILQSISSTGELTSCDLYLFEVSKPPIQYPLLGVTYLFSYIGGTFALIIASLVTTQGFNWRLAFWIGGIVALVGTGARKVLLESGEFKNINYRIETIAKNFNISKKAAKQFLLREEEIPNNKIVNNSIYITEMVSPIYFYLSYIYCGDLFKTLFNYSPHEVITHNLIISLFFILKMLFFMYISYYFHPLKILKIQLAISGIFTILVPFLFDYADTVWKLTAIQFGITILAINGFPGYAIFYKYIHITKRFTIASTRYAWGRASMFVATSFGTVFLTEKFGYKGMLVLFLPVLIGYTLTIFYFDKLEKESNAQKNNSKL